MIIEIASHYSLFSFSFGRVDAPFAPITSVCLLHLLQYNQQS